MGRKIKSKTQEQLLKDMGVSSMILTKIKYPKDKTKKKKQRRKQKQRYEKIEIVVFLMIINKQSFDFRKTHSNSWTRRREVFVDDIRETFNIDRHKPIWVNGFLKP